MKILILAATLLAIPLAVTIAQKKRVKQVQVTKRSIASLPPGKPYVIDLSQGGTVYNLAADLDYSSVKIRTSKGLVAITELTKNLNHANDLIVGMSDDIRFKDLEATVARQTNYSCGILTCECTGPADCVNLDRSGTCKGAWSCDRSGCACWKIPMR